MKVNVFLIFLFVLCLISCRPGYKEIDGKWAWVSYDTGEGKRVRHLKNVDPSSFSIFKKGNGQYAKDKNQVFYLKDVIDDADPVTFQVLNNQGYAKDKNHVYLDYQKVIYAHPKHFEVLAFPYSKDHQRAFCGTIPLEVKNLSLFKVTQKGHSMNYSKTSFFIKQNPDFKWLEKINPLGVIYGNGKAEAGIQKFEGFREIQ